MTADDGLLRIALAPVGQALAVGPRPHALDHALDDALGDDRGALRLWLIRDERGQHFVLLLLLVGEELRVERLRQL